MFEKFRSVFIHHFLNPEIEIPSCTSVYCPVSLRGALPLTTAFLSNERSGAGTGEVFFHQPHVLAGGATGQAWEGIGGSGGTGAQLEKGCAEERSLK